jgi:hypothetical protein
MTMMRQFSALATGLALAAGFAGAAKADGEVYYYADPPTLTYDTAPRVYYSEPVVVAPAPRIYYYTTPGYTTYYQPRVVYAAPPTTTYYYTEPRYIAPAQPYGYVPPGLSISTPTGTYAPFYGGWSSYSIENNSYRIGR